MFIGKRRSQWPSFLYAEKNLQGAGKLAIIKNSENFRKNRVYGKAEVLDA